jgi:hypothetical protein
VADDETIQAQQSIPADETVMADKTMLQPQAQGANLKFRLVGAESVEYPNICSDRVAH